MNSHPVIVQLMLLGSILLAMRIDSVSLPGCTSRCGDIVVPFPFGTTHGCSLDESFIITCNRSYNTPKPFLNFDKIEVIDISIDGHMRIAASVVSDCYDKSGSQINGSISKLTLSKFHISSTRNKFTAVGCDTNALVEGSEEWNQMSAGCVSWCDNIDRVVNGSCSGIGCCQTSIPKGVKDFFIGVQSFQNHSRVKTFNPCGYAFVVEAEAFKFSSLDLKDLRKRKTVPVMLDCDSSNGLGYNCNCLTGFEGNPYLDDGCRDINECESKPCQGTRKNLQGSYLCFCPEGFEGDGKKKGTGCCPKGRAMASIFLLIAAVLFFPAAGSCWIFWRSKKKKVVKLRRELYIQNGGLIFEKMLWKREPPKVFTAEDLRNATDNYIDSRCLYRDKHNEPVYRGSLRGRDGVNLLVTIKRYITIESLQIQEFIDKFVILFGIKDKNFENLIGYCLETRYPMLVYEFFTDKTLYNFIHDNASFLSWEIRLKIAEKTARAIVYLHDKMGTVVHGNIKSFNILLDSDCTVKVALPSLDGCMGTIGYLDPEACRLGKLTNKSDVYSFGIVLAELLTGEQVLNSDRPKGEEFLAKYFVSAIKEDRMREILVQSLVETVDIEQLKKVAMLTERCLRDQPEERPTMFEVATELQNVIHELDNDPRS
ncbi:Wall-associated receptor kinase 2 [Abeliophyllum distichum]|uniref:Wall-associated receptor kinase 2 n=1 Tax=Abeliophyllum distichum TaxID=126358 RepID=A0ABD1TK27_9LAMI